MNQMKWLLVIIGGVGVLLLGGLIVLYLANQSRQDLPKIGKVSNVRLTESKGSSITETDFQGKISIVNFFFTSCQGPCPRMNAKVAELYRRFSASDKVQFLSITVDPDRDSLSVLRQYGENMGVTDNRWKFVRGSSEAIGQLSEKIFLLPGDMPAMHSTKLVLVDNEGWIRGYYSSEDEASLKMLTTGIRALNKSMTR